MLAMQYKTGVYENQLHFHQPLLCVCVYVVLMSKIIRIGLFDQAKELPVSVGTSCHRPSPTALTASFRLTSPV